MGTMCDAQLYEAGGRTDFSAFQRAYGLSLAVIQHEVHGKFVLFHEKDVVNI